MEDQTDRKKRGSGPCEPVTAPANAAGGIQLAALVGENRMLVIGVGLFLIAGLIGFILMRRQRAGRPQASLLTQSMKR